MAVSIPIQKVTYNNGRVIVVANPRNSNGEIDVWTYSDTIFWTK